ncbi:MAG: V-type ATP synthase subunit K [Candidatus Brockarchaeota archaeon]|nr:V-type ATP synthase subunit K [Candidatus Brockarchaeota archaeon]
MDIFTLVSVLSAIGFSGVGSMLGIAMTASVSSRMVSEKPEKFGLALVFTVLAETPVIYGLLVSLFIIMNGSSVNDFNTSISILSAGLSVGLTGLFSGLGIGIAGSAALGAVSERDELFGKSLIFTVLPESIVIYGLLVSIVIVRGAGLLGGGGIHQLDSVSAYTSLASSAIICVTGGSGYYLGKTGAKAISSLLKDEDSFGKSIVFVVLIESIAIYGLLVAILLLRGVGML